MGRGIYRFALAAWREITRRHRADRRFPRVAETGRERFFPYFLLILILIFLFYFSYGGGRETGAVKSKVNPRPAVVFYLDSCRAIPTPSSKNTPIAFSRDDKQASASHNSKSRYPFHARKQNDFYIVSVLNKYIDYYVNRAYNF